MSVALLPVAPRYRQPRLVPGRIDFGAGPGDPRGAGARGLHASFGGLELDLRRASIREKPAESATNGTTRRPPRAPRLNTVQLRRQAGPLLLAVLAVMLADDVPVWRLTGPDPTRQASGERPS